MKKILKLVLFLGIVSAVSGLLLGFVNSITDPLIKEAAVKAEKANLEIMYPGAEFEPAGENLVDGTTILGIYEAKNNGYIFKLWGKGYASSGITVLAGFDYDGTLQKIVALEQQETNGFGSKVFDQLESLYVGSALGDEPNMLAGATVTSNAMKGMLNAAKAAFPNLG